MPSKYFYSKESPHFFEDTEWTPFEEAEELEIKSKCWEKMWEQLKERVEWIADELVLADMRKLEEEYLK